MSTSPHLADGWIITPVPAFQDNYIWCIYHPDHATTIVVDPGDADPVLAWLAREARQLTDMWITHHHADHTGGVRMLRHHFPQAKVFTPWHDHRIGPSIHVTPGFAVDLLGIPGSVEIIACPGHTADHIAYYWPSQKALFCGDTLFAGGCGRIFDGSAALLYESLQRLQSLPDDTRIYCAHEYTEANLRFAIKVDPDHTPYHARLACVQSLRHQNLPSVPSTMAEERLTNVFLRCKNLEAFTAMRIRKDLDRG